MSKLYWFVYSGWGRVSMYALGVMTLWMLHIVK